MYSADKSRARQSEAIGRLGHRDEASGSPCQACPVRLRSICSGLEFDELEELEKIVARMTVGAGSPIFDEGETARCRYNVTSGSIKIYKLLGDGRRQIIGFLFPGDFLGLALADEYASAPRPWSTASCADFPGASWTTSSTAFPHLKTGC